MVLALISSYTYVDDFTSHSDKTLLIWNTEKIPSDLTYNLNEHNTSNRVKENTSQADCRKQLNMSDDQKIYS